MEPVIRGVFEEFANTQEFCFGSKAALANCLALVGSFTEATFPAL